MNKFKATALILIFSMIIFVSACTNQNNISKTNTKQSILDEIDRLNSLNSNGLLKTDDFLNLEGMLSKDENALGEITEIKAMVKYKEYYHIFHGLGFLADYIQSGKKTLCPGHSLSHYYIFMKHNETDFANDNLNEAKDVLPQWIPLARVYANNQSIIDFDKIVERIQKDIENIDSGNVTGSNEEIDWLSSDGSICV